MGSSQGKAVNSSMSQTGRLYCTDEHHLCKGTDFTDIYIFVDLYGFIGGAWHRSDPCHHTPGFSSGVMENNIKLVIPNF